LLPGSGHWVRVRVRVRARERVRDRVRNRVRDRVRDRVRVVSGCVSTVITLMKPPVDRSVSVTLALSQALKLTLPMLPWQSLTYL